MGETSGERPAAATSGMDRRGFLSGSSAAMAAGLVAGYGTLAAMAGRFLYPSSSHGKAWMFVRELSGVEVGEAITLKTPAGADVVVTRRGELGGAGDFIALSSTCPHLGCRVHWEELNHRFFCPCHNGVFDPQGKATAGPPAAAGQSLLQYPLKVEHGLLFIEIPTETLVTKESSLAATDSSRAAGPRQMLAGAPPVKARRVEEA